MICIHNCVIRLQQYVIYHMLLLWSILKMLFFVCCNACFFARVCQFMGRKISVGGGGGGACHQKLEIY